MSDAHVRAAEAAETMAAALSASIQREQVWRERADLAQISADAARERERVAAQVSRDALVEAARAQAIAVLAAALVPNYGVVRDAVSVARAALFGADAARAMPEVCPHDSDCDGKRTCPPGFRGPGCVAIPMPCDDCALYPQCEDGDLEPPDPGQPCPRKPPACDHSGIGLPGCPMCDVRTKAEGGPR